MLSDTKSIKESLKEYARGIAGGLLFSFPLLYTMEVWWAGFTVPTGSLLILIGITFLLLLGYNRFAGLRPDSSWREVAIDSVEELGIGLIISFAVLLMLNRIVPGVMPINEIMGKVVIEAMAVSIGVSIGTAQLGTGEGGGKTDESNHSLAGNEKVALVVLAMCGSLIVGGNVAPTEEVLMIAAESKPINILVMSTGSILLTVVIIYFSGFRGSHLRKENAFYHLVFDTCICYLTALAVSAFVLWFFGKFAGMGFWIIFSQIIVLGVLSSLGASAGRLLIK